MLTATESDEAIQYSTLGNLPDRIRQCADPHLKETLTRRFQRKMNNYHVDMLDGRLTVFQMDSNGIENPVLLQHEACQKIDDCHLTAYGTHRPKCDTLRKLLENYTCENAAQIVTTWYKAHSFADCRKKVRLARAARAAVHIEETQAIHVQSATATNYDPFADSMDSEEVARILRMSGVDPPPLEELTIGTIPILLRAAGFNEEATRQGGSTPSRVKLIHPNKTKMPLPPLGVDDVSISDDSEDTNADMQPSEHSDDVTGDSSATDDAPDESPTKKSRVLTRNKSNTTTTSSNNDWASACERVSSSYHENMAHLPETSSAISTQSSGKRGANVMRRRPPAIHVVAAGDHTSGSSTFRPSFAGETLPSVQHTVLINNLTTASGIVGANSSENWETAEKTGDRFWMKELGPIRPSWNRDHYLIYGMDDHSRIMSGSPEYDCGLEAFADAMARLIKRFNRLTITEMIVPFRFNDAEIGILGGLVQSKLINQSTPFIRRGPQEHMILDLCHKFEISTRRTFRDNLADHQVPANWHIFMPHIFSIVNFDRSVRLGVDPFNTSFMLSREVMFEIAAQPEPTEHGVVDDQEDVAQVMEPGLNIWGAVVGNTVD